MENLFTAPQQTVYGDLTYLRFSVPLYPSFWLESLVQGILKLVCQMLVPRSTKTFTFEFDANTGTCQGLP